MQLLAMSWRKRNSGFGVMKQQLRRRHWINADWRKLMEKHLGKGKTFQIWEVASWKEF